MHYSQILISLIMSWTGDYQSKVQFDGPINSEIKAEYIDPLHTDPIQKNNTSCDIYGRFQQVILKVKTKKEKFIKATFNFNCENKKHSMPAQFIRESDLTVQKNTIFISEKYKKNTIKVESLSLESVKKK